MRVLALVTDAFGGRGGVAQYNRDLLTALVAQGGTHVEVMPRRSPDTGDTPPAGIRQHRAIMARARFAIAGFGASLRSRPDVVFCGHLYMAPLAALIAKITGAKLVVQLHGVEAWPRPSSGQRRAVERADIVLCVSRYTRARVLAWADITPERVIVAPNTVSPVYTPAGDRPANGSGREKQRVLLSVGRLDSRERYKGHDRVISALPQVIADGVDVVYMVAGEGDDQARLAALAAELGVADRVVFLGQVAPHLLPALYRDADLFLMPSTGEGFGIVFLEAMASGLPALGLAVAGAIDALGDGQLGIAVTETEFSAELRRLLRDPQSLPRDQTARADLARRTRERFAPESFAAFVSGVFTQLA